jgi:hypothetical protein
MGAAFGRAVKGAGALGNERIRGGGAIGPAGRAFHGGGHMAVQGFYFKRVALSASALNFDWDHNTLPPSFERRASWCVTVSNVTLQRRVLKSPE